MKKKIAIAIGCILFVLLLFGIYELNKADKIFKRIKYEKEEINIVDEIEDENIDETLEEK